jgi:ketosteroid isomerase-like protein
MVELVESKEPHMKKLLFIVSLLALATTAWAQSGSKDPVDKTIKPPTDKRSGGGSSMPKPQATPKATPKAPAKTTPKPAGEAAVRATFDKLVAGINAADVDKVTGIYWNSPRLTIYNYNGTVTRGWDQMHTNRQNSYPNLKDVSLVMRDVRIEMIGTDGAVLMYYWTQSQTTKGVADTSTGRTTLVWRHFANGWKIIHTHASPDNPDPSRLPPPEERETRPRTAPAGE